VQYKLAVMVHRCLHRRAPRYLTDYCVPVSEVLSRQHLRSVRRHQLSVPRVHHSTFGSRCFFCLRTNSLEFTARWSAWSSCWLWIFYAELENTSIHWTLRNISILEVLCKFMFTCLL